MHALEKKRPYYLHTHARKRGIKHNWMKIFSKDAAQNVIEGDLIEKFLLLNQNLTRSLLLIKSSDRWPMLGVS